MTSRNISITDDAYQILLKMKLKDESFSGTIRRLARRGRISDCAGLWSDLPREDVEAIKRNIAELRERFDFEEREKDHR